MKKYRQQNPNTTIGEPGRYQGFNTGVVLYNLQRMRDNEKYNQYVDNVNEAIDKLAEKYLFRSHLGDQCFFTLLGIEYPDWFSVLPCGYNFQLDISLAVQLAFRPIFDLYHNCTETPKIYHGNGGTEIPDD